MGRAIRQSFFRPLLFYVVVGALLGFTVLYIIAKMSADLRAVAVLRLVGGTYILALAPPVSAILFAATSGNAVNAWLRRDACSAGRSSRSTASGSRRRATSGRPRGSRSRSRTSAR